MDVLSVNSMLIDGVNSRSVGGGAKFKNKDTLLAQISLCLENSKTGFVQFMDTDELVATRSTEFIVM